MKPKLICGHCGELLMCQLDCSDEKNRRFNGMWTCISNPLCPMYKRFIKLEEIECPCWAYTQGLIPNCNKCKYKDKKAKKNE